MEVNWFVIAIVVAVVVILIVFVIRRNNKDKKALEKFLNHDLNKKKESKF